MIGIDGSVAQLYAFLFSSDSHWRDSMNEEERPVLVVSHE
jgi:hypothetical protein